MQGPTPSTDREYLIEIFAATRELQTQVAEILARQEADSRRIHVLEEWKSRVKGGLAVVLALGGFGSLITAALKGWMKVP
ncbi:MAG: hypothetical protein EPO21_13065 [Chloroflexota bacterium]|nr:MAG: hypothetical protein EPO21_13065 [Chloroflexota bacterium]